MLFKQKRDNHNNNRRSCAKAQLYFFEAAEITGLYKKRNYKGGNTQNPEQSRNSN